MRNTTAPLKVLGPMMALLIGNGCATAWYVTNVDPRANCKSEYYFLDADGDGWGDPDAERETLCEPDVERSVTARNQLDCDDSDAGVTAKLDALCPHELVTEIEYTPGEGDPSTWYVSAKNNDTELVATGGDTPPSYALGAESACFFWGGSLAKLSSGDDKGDILAAIESTLDGTETYAAWVAIMWDEDEWRWMEPEDMDPDGIIPGAPAENFPELAASGEDFTTSWCGDEPPTELDAAGQPFEEQWIKRVALIGRPSGGSYSWCYGSPEDAADYAWDEAHFICERGAPSNDCYGSANDYCVYRTPDEVSELNGGDAE